MADSNDWLGGYTLEELLGAAPVVKTKKELKKESGKRGIVSATLGAPFRFIGAILKMPFKLAGIAAKLPKGVLRMMLRPFRGGSKG